MRIAEATRMKNVQHRLLLSHKHTNRDMKNQAYVFAKRSPVSIYLCDSFIIAQVFLNYNMFFIYLLSRGCIPLGPLLKTI